MPVVFHDLIFCDCPLLLQHRMVNVNRHLTPFDAHSIICITIGNKAISCDTARGLVLDRLGLFWSFHVAIFILGNSNQIIIRCYQCHCPFAKVYGLSSCNFGDFLLATGLGFAPGFNLFSVKHRERIQKY